MPPKNFPRFSVARLYWYLRPIVRCGCKGANLSWCGLRDDVWVGSNGRSWFNLGRDVINFPSPLRVEFTFPTQHICQFWGNFIFLVPSWLTNGYSHPFTKLNSMNPLLLPATHNILDMYTLLDRHPPSRNIENDDETTTHCIVSTDRAAFSYNKRISRSATFQAHKMILRAPTFGWHLRRGGGVPQRQASRFDWFRILQENKAPRRDLGMAGSRHRPLSLHQEEQRKLTRAVSQHGRTGGSTY